MKSGQLGWVIVFLTLLSACLEGPLAHRIQIAGVPPPLVLVVVYNGALLRGRAFGASLGFLVGLIQAALSGEGEAALMVSGAASGFVAGWAPRFISPRHWAVGPVVTFVCFALAKVLFVLINPSKDFASWVKLAGIGGLYGAALSVPLYLLLLKATKPQLQH